MCAWLPVFSPGLPASAEVPPQTYWLAMRAETKVQLALTIVGIPVIMLVVWNPSGSTKWPNPFREALDSIGKAGDK